MTEKIIDNIDFHNIDIMRYWSFPSTWDTEKKKKTVNERIFSGEWYGSLKRDGSFYKFTKDENGEMELIGRSKGVSGDYLDKIDWVPHLWSFFQSLPNGTCLLGELYLPSKEEAKSTTSIMNCKAEKAIARQEKEKLHYYIFDILADHNESYINMKAIDRFLTLDHYKQEYSQYDFVEWANYYNGQNLWNKLQNYLADGLEGVVITHQDAPYRVGKRPSKETLKIKKELQESVDCFVIGANEPTKLYSGKEIEKWMFWFDENTNQKLNKPMYREYALGMPISPVTKNWYYGWAGSLKLGAYQNGKIVHIGNLSGISDEVKENWKEYIGVVAEITAMEIMENKDGSKGIRHPKLIRFRPDKNKQDCKFEDIFE